MGLRGANVVVLANWINDGKAVLSRSARDGCYNGTVATVEQSVEITVTNLKRVIETIHGQSPSTLILVLARYPDVRQIVYANLRTMRRVQALNDAVKDAIIAEPNTHFVNLQFPYNVSIFQNRSLYHPNCRGDKVIVQTLLDALFQHKVLARSLAQGGSSECLSNADCETLSLPCCQTS